MIQVHVFGCSETFELSESKTWEEAHQIRVIFHSTGGDTQAHRIFSEKRPDVIVTVGDSPKPFTVLRKMPRYVRRRWIHVQTLEDMTVDRIHACFYKALEEKPAPVISVFTSTYHSGERILRPFSSLQAQDMPEWEWVIMDDSTTADEGKTWATLVELSHKDCRIRIFRPSGNDGYIGSVKRNVATMCRGTYLVELDHDDELVPEALGMIKTAFEKHPEVGMVGSDCSEIYEKTLQNHQYGPYFGLGYGSYCRERYQDRWINVARLGPLNRYTLRHIVGVANHVRAWRADIYYALGGHDENLNVADDYDLILRTFTKEGVRIGRIPRFLYIQYRNEGGNNFTFHRNRLIQKLVEVVRKKHDEKIHKTLEALEVPDFELNVSTGLYERDWKHPPNYWTFWETEKVADLVLEPNPETVSIVMPTYNRPDALRRAVGSVLAQDHKDWVLYIIGDQCLHLDEMMEKETMFHDPRIRYWNLPENTKEGGTTPRNYALKMLVTTDYVAYLDDDNYWLPDHLSSLWSAMHPEDPEPIMFAFSSFTSGEFTIRCKEPIRYRIDTSCVLHRRSLVEKHGYWKKQSAVGYAHDFELVSRWVEAGERWAATEKATLMYENTHQNMKLIYEAYPDQHPDQHLDDKKSKITIKEIEGEDSDDECDECESVASPVCDPSCGEEGRIN